MVLGVGAARQRGLGAGLAWGSWAALAACRVSWAGRAALRAHAACRTPDAVRHDMQRVTRSMSGRVRPRYPRCFHSRPPR
eukprot:3882603-Alexandrium_andersonii.AAC.1